MRGIFGLLAKTSPRLSELQEHPVQVRQGGDGLTKPLSLLMLIILRKVPCSS